MIKNNKQNKNYKSNYNPVNNINKEQTIKRKSQKPTKLLNNTINLNKKCYNNYNDKKCITTIFFQLQLTDKMQPKLPHSWYK